MKPYLQFSALCDDVGRSSDGKLVVYGVFEGILSQAFPATHRSCFVCNRWTGGTGTHREQIRILAPNNRVAVVEGPETEFHLTNRASVHTVVCRLEGLAFERPGVYWVHVVLDGEVVCEYALNVKLRSEEARPAGPRLAPPAKKLPVQD